MLTLLQALLATTLSWLLARDRLAVVSPRSRSLAPCRVLNLLADEALPDCEAGTSRGQVFGLDQKRQQSLSSWNLFKALAYDPEVQK